MTQATYKANGLMRDKWARDIAIVGAVAGGMTQRAVGDVVGLTGARVGQVCDEVRRIRMATARMMVGG